MKGSVHRAVLLNEVIEGLNLRVSPSSRLVILDATFGGGGHSSGICERHKGVKIIALDQDEGALKKGEAKFKNSECEVSFVNENFRNLDKALEGQGEGSVDGIIFDLGLSSDQLGNSGRGFSFLHDEPLIMTMKENPSSESLTAREVVNTWEEENLEKIIRGYGEEKFSKRIAKAIVERREEREIESTLDLIEIIRGAIPQRARSGKINFATRTFQAIRISVNDELGALQEGLEKGFEALKEGGRMAVISFHSLEDRIVKRFYKEKEKEGAGIIINKKVIVAGETETKNNPRSRSAKLRILEKK